MEDAHVTELSLDGTSRNPSNAFFAVYDGHCGDTVAHFAANRLHRCLRELEPYKKERYDDALIKAFLKTDEAIYQGIVCLYVTLLFATHTRSTELVPQTGSIADPEIIFTKGMMYGSCAISALFTSDDRLFVVSTHAASTFCFAGAIANVI